VNLEKLKSLDLACEVREKTNPFSVLQKSATALKLLNN